MRRLFPPTPTRTAFRWQRVRQAAAGPCFGRFGRLCYFLLPGQRWRRRHMRGFRFRASVAVPVLVLVLATAGGVVAATQSSDEQALAPTRQQADRDIERRGETPLAEMNPHGK